MGKFICDRKIFCRASHKDSLVPCGNGVFSTGRNGPLRSFCAWIPLLPRRPKHFRTSAPSLYHERTACELMIRLEGESQRLVSIRHGSLQLKLRLLIGGRGGHKGIRLTAPIDQMCSRRCALGTRSCLVQCYKLLDLSEGQYNRTYSPYCTRLRCSLEDALVSPADRPFLTFPSDHPPRRLIAISSALFLRVLIPHFSFLVLSYSHLGTSDVRHYLREIPRLP